MKKGKKDSTPVTKADVKEIVTEIITEAFDSFAIIVKKGFDDVNDRMVTKEEFYPFKKATETSFYNLQTDVTDLKTRMTRVENRLDRVEYRLDSVEVKFDIFDQKIDTVVDMHKDHDVRIRGLEGKLV
jgi:hypothetical protein